MQERAASRYLAYVCGHHTCSEISHRSNPSRQAQRSRKVLTTTSLCFFKKKKLLNFFLIVQSLSPSGLPLDSSSSHSSCYLQADVSTSQTLPPRPPPHLRSPHSLGPQDFQGFGESSLTETRLGSPLVYMCLEGVGSDQKESDGRVIGCPLDDLYLRKAVEVASPVDWVFGWEILVPVHRHE